MFELNIPEKEYYDYENEEFVTLEAVTLELEHSLVSLSKWESKWEKPFLDDHKKTDAESVDYVRCMVTTKNYDPSVLSRLGSDQVEQISKYIDAKMTATWFNESQSKAPGKKEVITAELIYYWMISLTIPFECQHWHLNRLLTLVKVCNLKNQPEKGGKKMGRAEMASRNRALNEQRRAQMKTSG